MSQLLEFKIKPFEAVRFRQQARLISEDTLAIEKQKALARRVVFTQNANAGSGADMKYINKVNRTFSSVASQTAQKVPLTATGSAQIPAPGIRTSSGTSPETFSDSGAFAEPQAIYTQQRGTLEARVASGDVAYIPAIEMTIITSWPEVDFTYTGGFNYVPPREESSDTVQMNVTI